MFITSNLRKRFAYFFLFFLASSVQVPSHAVQMLRDAIAYASHSISVMRYGPQTKEDFYNAIYGLTLNYNEGTADRAYIKRLKVFITNKKGSDAEKDEDDSGSQSVDQEDESVKKSLSLLNCFEKGLSLADEAMAEYDLADFQRLHDAIQTYENPTAGDSSDSEDSGQKIDIEPITAGDITESEHSSADSDSESSLGSDEDEEDEKIEVIQSKEHVEEEPLEFSLSSENDYPTESIYPAPSEEQESKSESSGWELVAAMAITAASVATLAGYTIYKRRVNEGEATHA